MSEILHETFTPKTHRCIVRLTGDYVGELNELLVKFEGSAKLTRVRDGARPQHFVMSASEAEAFVEAWAQFRADSAAATEAEEQRREVVLAEAYAITKEIPAIEVGRDGAGWTVAVAGPGFTWAPYCAYIDTPDQLLATVQSARRALAKHVVYLRGEQIDNWRDGLRNPAEELLAKYGYLAPFAEEDQTQPLEDHPY